MHGVCGFGVLVVKALLEAAPDSGEDGFRCRTLRRLAAWDIVVRRVGGAAGAVNLEECNGVKEAPRGL